MGDHPSIGWPPLPAYTGALEILGRGLILWAMVLLLVSAAAWALKRERIGKVSFSLGIVGLIGAFALLIWLIYNRQYQFEYVFKHSDNWLPDGKRVASLWGGQEGSFLLWAVVAGLFGLVSVGTTGIYRRGYTIAYSLFLGGLAAILVYESPFRLYQPPAEMAAMVKGMMPPDGAGLTPALVNWWMQIHPPTIFLGFGSLTVVYAFAVAALAHGNLTDWIRAVRPWAILSMTLTGLGLCMGGFWAYETLGWGGFWMWDPVENAALVPWLLMAAFIHGLFVQVARGKWALLNALFGGLGLISFIYGTFLTRSGFLGDTSVHSFAEMDRNALWLLTSLGVMAIASLLGLILYRGVKMRSESRTAPKLAKTPLNLVNAYGWAMTALTALALACGIGMSVPLIMSLQGQQPRIVEEALYNRVTAFIFIPCVLLMGVGPYLSWRGLPLRDLVTRLATAMALSLGFLGIGMFLLRTIPAGMELKPDTMTTFPAGLQVPTVPWVLFLSWLCLFAVMANVVRIGEDWKKRLSSVPAFVTHVGVILTVLGLIVSRGLERKEQFNVQAGRPGSALGYSFALQENTLGLLERENRVQFEVVGRGQQLLAKPVLFYTEVPNDEPSPTVRPFIFHGPLHDFYITVFPMVFEATEETTLAPGGKAQFEGTVITYKRMVQSGEAGVMGTTFGAELEFLTPEGQVSTVIPKVEIGENGIRQIQAEAGEYFVFLNRIEASDQSVVIQLHYKNPVFPMEVFYKPLPGLVWWGTGIMTVGGLLAALHRRRLAKSGGTSEPGGDVSDPAPAEPTDYEAAGSVGAGAANG